MILLSIRDIVISFAERYGLNAWDWISIAITISTLIISSISLIVARKTLKSQKQTELNTNPDINISSQSNLLMDLVRDTLFAYQFLFALHFQLIKTNFNVKPSHHIWNYIKIPLNYLHEELFYGDSIKLDYFREFSNSCKQLQYDFDALKLSFQNKNKSNLNYIIIHAYTDIGIFIETYLKCLKNSFGFDENAINAHVLLMKPTIGKKGNYNDPSDRLQFIIDNANFGFGLYNTRGISEAVVYMRDIIDFFLEMILCALQNNNIHIDFKSSLWNFHRNLDIIILNTLYKDNPFKMELNKEKLMRENLFGELVPENNQVPIPDTIVKYCYFYILEDTVISKDSSHQDRENNQNTKEKRAKKG